MHVDVTRYDLRRLRLGQALVPAAVVMTIVWRHKPGPPTLAVAVALLASALVSLLLARRRLGQADLVAEHGKLRLGADGPKLLPSAVTAWTWDDDGCARVYDRTGSWMLTAINADDGGAVRAALAGVLGKPLTLQRRGSARARSWALVAAATGLLVTVAAFVLDTPAFAFAGVPALVIGIATFGALSQKVSAGPS